MTMEFDNYTVRQVRMDDLSDYFSMIETNRPRLNDFFAGTMAMTRTLEETSDHLADVIAKAEKNNYFPFVVVDNNTNRVIGSIQVKNIDWTIPKAELGYYIDEQYGGKEITTRAVALIIDFCFKELNLNKLYLRTHEENIPSRKVAEKNGFSVEGVIRRDYKTTGGGIVDLMYYGLLNPNT